jgi:hypothetical protein
VCLCVGNVSEVKRLYIEAMDGEWKVRGLVGVDF